MATLHRIVLAIASSWNNGTSSPASQGNRAWSNETNALAERQEQTSAKTPPLLNRIGKGIGKFWIPILLITAICLTPAKVAGFTLGELSLAQAIMQALVAKLNGTIVKEVIEGAGKFLVTAIGEWGVSEALDATLRGAKGQEATCGVNGAKWLSNSYKYTVSKNYSGSYPFTPTWLNGRIWSAHVNGVSADDEEWEDAFGNNPMVGNTTISSLSKGTHQETARQGHQKRNDTATGTFLDGTAMTQHEAKGKLRHKRGAVVTAILEVIYYPNWLNQKYIGYEKITARKDLFDWAKQERLRRLQSGWGAARCIWGKELIRYTEEFNVGSYEMVSDFHDPLPVLDKLAEPGTNPQAQSYEVTATWEMRPIFYGGNLGAKRPMKKTFPKGDRDERGELRFPSYTDNEVTWEFCRANQAISDIQVADSITRKVQDRTIYELQKRARIGPITGAVVGFYLEKVPIGKESVVIQDEN